MILMCWHGAFSTRSKHCAETGSVGNLLTLWVRRRAVNARWTRC